MTALDEWVASSSRKMTEQSHTFGRNSGFRKAKAEPTAATSGRPWSRRYHTILCVSDGVALICVALLAASLRFGLGPADVQVGSMEVGYSAVSAGVVALWMLMLGWYRSRDPRVVGIGSDEFKRVLSATVTLLGLLALICLAFHIELARGYVALAFPFGVVALTASRWAWRLWLTRQRRYGHYLCRVVVLGRKKDVRYVIKQLQSKSGAAYEVIGAAVPDLGGAGVLDVGDRAIPVVANATSIVECAARLGADAVIVAGQLKGGSDYIQRLGWKLEESATELILATGLTNVAGPRIHARPVEGLPLMHVELPQYTGGRHILKRFMDVVLSALALVVLSPLFLFLTIVIRLDSPGPGTFKQERVGKSGKKFVMYKFRSMVQTAESELGGLLNNNEAAGVMFKMHNDPRITRTGHWTRKYSLDELPQFWNVLIGDMSLVGPRPPLESEVNGYRPRVYRRLYIKPGLTGMWQINGRSELNWQDSVRLDLYYVENWSVMGDLIILWKTFQAVWKPVGAY